MKYVALIISLIFVLGLVGCEKEIDDNDDSCNSGYSWVDGKCELDENPIDNVDDPIYIANMNSNYIPFEAAITFMEAHPYFELIYYNDENVILYFTENGTAYQINVSGVIETISLSLSGSDRIFYYDETTNEIYYRKNSSLYKIGFDTQEVENLQLSGEIQYISSGMVLFGNNTVIFKYPNSLATLTDYQKAFSFYKDGKLQYGVYKNLATSSEVAIYSEDTIVVEGTFDGICTQVLGYGENFVAFKIPYGSNNTYETRQKIGIFNTQGEISYIEFEDYELISNMAFYDYMAVVTYTDSTKKYYVYETQEIFDLRPTGIVDDGFLSADADYYYGYDRNDNFLQVSKTSGMAVLNVASTTDNMKPVVEFYDGVTSIYSRGYYPLFSGGIYKPDGTVINDQICLYTDLNENKGMFLVETQSDIYELYILDKITYQSSKVEEFNSISNFLIYVVDDYFAFLDYSEDKLTAQYPNMVDLIFYDFYGEYQGTYKRHSHSLLTSYTDENGSWIFTEYQ